MLDDATLDQAAALLAALQAKGLTLATAESCTGGLIAAALTAIAGSSATVLCGYVTYSNEAKAAMLGVAPGVIAELGAVSEEVARAMAAGALERSGAHLAVACTGVAGPDGGSATKPVGLVHLAAARRGGALVHLRQLFPGDRAAVREATVREAFRLLAELAGV
jgi:nicotinamide-nucleotide amidase